MTNRDAAAAAKSRARVIDDFGAKGTAEDWNASAARLLVKWDSSTAPVEVHPSRVAIHDAR